jgi:hypothetical protein
MRSRISFKFSNCSTSASPGADGIFNALRDSPLGNRSGDMSDLSWLTDERMAAHTAGQVRVVHPDAGKACHPSLFTMAGLWAGK